MKHNQFIDNLPIQDEICRTAKPYVEYQSLTHAHLCGGLGPAAKNLWSQRVICFDIITGAMGLQCHLLYISGLPTNMGMCSTILAVIECIFCTNTRAPTQTAMLRSVGFMDV